MKTKFKYFLIALVCIVLIPTKSHAVSWCFQSYRNLYICAGYTWDLDVINKLIYDEIKKLRDTKKDLNGTLALMKNNIRLALVGGEDASESEVIFLGHSLSAMDKTPEAEVSGSSSSGMQQDETMRTMMALFTRPDTSVKASENAKEAMDKFYILRIKRAMEENYDAIRKLEEKSDILEKAKEAAKEDNDYNENIRYRHAVATMNTADLKEIIKVQANSGLLLISKNIYGSPSIVGRDIKSAENTNEALSTGR